MPIMIDADALLEELNDKNVAMLSALIEEQRTISFYVYFKVVEVIEKMPAIDAVPVKHGHWITKTRHEHYPSGKEYEEDFCSACSMRGSIEYDYCPHCGAKMDEVSE